MIFPKMSRRFSFTHPHPVLYENPRVLCVFLIMLMLLATGGLFSGKPLSPHPSVLIPRPSSLNPLLPSCSERPMYLGIVGAPRVNPRVFCIEGIIDDNSAGELAFTALAVAPDGTLYAARPLTGQVLALDDTNGDGLPDKPRLVAEHLTLPNGLAYADGALYISGGSHLYRWQDGKLDTLVDDLPTGSGFWTGGIAVGDDQRLYVATGAPCDFCQPDNPERGAILSFALDGADRRLIATGLRQPTALAFRAGALWTVDTARDGLANVPDLDELDRVTPGANFGFPFCIGRDNHPDTLQGAFNCADATPPALSLPTHSTPLGMAAYDADTFPTLKGTLLIALGGSYDAYALAGYQLVAVHFDAGGSPTGAENLMPYSAGNYILPSALGMNYQGLGFYPHRPFDVVVSPQGWVYLSMGGGRILALRPQP
jgi:glucose/arabinose dehydrogenase